MWLLYYSAISIYVGIIRLAALKSGKAKKWINGRKNWRSQILQISGNTKPKVWVHCASLGEFEQGRPIIEKLKNEYPGHLIVLTFFSPSGYEIRKNYENADVVMYLPADIPGNANAFLSAINPSLVIFVKYEFWMGYLSEISKRNIPALIISARFRKNQLFFGIAGAWFRKYLKAFKPIHVQDESSKILLNKYQISNVVVSGDTRYDRVIANALNPKELPEIKNWIQNRKAFIVGSSWKEDENVIFPWKLNDYVLIIAPHEIDEQHILDIENCCGGKSIRYTDLLEGKNVNNSSILIINTIGILMAVFKLGTISYVGGAFRKTLHNILEPASMGLPVIFGPMTEKFPEADALIDAGGGFQISNRAEFLDCIDYLIKDGNAQKHGRQSFEFVQENKGATEIIMNDIRKLLEH
jgi:3-deoxy-D-manno-octulosonic-acid transferase